MDREPYWLKTADHGEHTTAAKIPWPAGRRRKGPRRVVVYGDLARAVRRESAQALAYWWGVGKSTVGKWRKALGVPDNNEGTLTEARIQRSARREEGFEAVLAESLGPGATAQVCRVQAGEAAAPACRRRGAESPPGREGQRRGSPEDAPDSQAAGDKAACRPRVGKVGGRVAGHAACDRSGTPDSKDNDRNLLSAGCFEDTRWAIQSE
jgi:hypothetical protein